MSSDPNNTGDTADSTVGAASPGNQTNADLDKNRGNADSGRPSAIERQRTALQFSVSSDSTAQETPQLQYRLRSVYADDGQASNRLVRRVSITLLLAASGLALALTVNRIPMLETVTRTQQTLDKITKTLLTNPASNVPGAVEKTNAISIPIDNINLRDRPELLQQLVAVYRLRLATDPHDAEVMATLAQLREHSLAELVDINPTEELSLAITSLKRVTEAFPELADDSRYQSFAARIDENNAAPIDSQTTIDSQKNIESQTNIASTVATASAVTTDRSTQSDLSAKPDQSAPSIATAEPVLPETKTTATALKPVDSRSAELLNAFNSKTVNASSSKTAVTAVALKPEIHVISLTPGIIEANHFVPTDGGNVFILSINFRNLGSAQDNQAAELVTRLSTSDNPQILAEVPLELSGSSGKKSFLIGTFEHGHPGEAYKLTFILNGQVLPVRTSRLSLLASNVDTDI